MNPVIIEIKPLKLRYNKGNGTQTPGNGARLSGLIKKQEAREILKQRLSEITNDN